MSIEQMENQITNLLVAKERLEKKVKELNQRCFDQQRQIESLQSDKEKLEGKFGKIRDIGYEAFVRDRKEEIQRQNQETNDFLREIQMDWGRHYGEMLTSIPDKYLDWGRMNLPKGLINIPHSKYTCKTWGQIFKSEKLRRMRS